MLVRLLIAAVFLLLASNASARWNSSQSVIHGTAYSLENDEFIIGVFSPISYGANNGVTLSTHPILWVLLTPNGDVKWRVFQSDHVALAFTVGGSKEFGIEGAPAGQDPRSKGSLSASTILSVDLGHGVILSGQTGYRRSFDPDDDSMTFGGSLTFLLNSAHMVLMQSDALYSANSSRIVSPAARLVYVHAWENMRASVGIAYGEFPVLTNVDNKIDISTMPVWPVIDLWWRY